MFLALLLGAGLLLCNVLCSGIQTMLIVRVITRLIPEDGRDLGFWKDVGIMVIVTLITSAAHLVGIALWAVVYLLGGETTSFETAFYFSAETYTALGYGDIVLSARWRLLGPLEAINGLLLFGLSTAIMFAVLSRLIKNHLRRLGGAGPKNMAMEGGAEG